MSSSGLSFLKGGRWPSDKPVIHTMCMERKRYEEQKTTTKTEEYSDTNESQLTVLTLNIELCSVLNIHTINQSNESSSLISFLSRLRVDSSRGTPCSLKSVEPV